MEYGNIETYKTRISKMFKDNILEELKCLKTFRIHTNDSTVYKFQYPNCVYNWIEHILLTNEPIDLVYELGTLNKMIREKLNKIRRNLDNFGNIYEKDKSKFYSIKILYDRFIFKILKGWTMCIDNDKLSLNSSILHSVLTTIGNQMNIISELIDKDKKNANLDMEINNLVVSGLQFCHRMKYISYGVDYEKRSYVENPKLKLVDNFFNYLEMWIEITCFPYTNYTDAFMDWRCTALYTNKNEIFNIAMCGDSLCKAFKTKDDLNNNISDNKIAPNITMLSKDDKIDISTLSNASSSNLREIKKSGLLSNPTFNVNIKSLMKLLASNKTITLNQIKMFDNNSNRLYTRILMEKSGDPYILIFDENDSSSICGLMLESTSGDNNYIKILLTNDDYKYEFDDIITRMANNEDIFKNE